MLSFYHLRLDTKLEIIPTLGSFKLAVGNLGVGSGVYVIPESIGSESTIPRISV